MELAASGRWQAAADQLRRVLRISPQDAGAARKLAEVLEQLGDRSGAISYLRLACNNDPQNGMSWIWLARLQLNAGDAPEALRAAQRAVKLAEGVPDAHLSLGFALYRTGDSAGAARSFARALELDPDNKAALEALTLIRAHPPQPRRGTRRSIPVESAHVTSSPLEGA